MAALEDAFRTAIPAIADTELVLVLPKTGAPGRDAIDVRARIAFAVVASRI